MGEKSLASQADTANVQLSPSDPVPVPPQVAHGGSVYSVHAENRSMDTTAGNIIADGLYKSTEVAGILSFCRHNVRRSADRATVFLDRDGVLNRRIIGGYVTHWREFVWLPGVLESLRRLTDAGLQLVIISNQAGVAKGVLTCAGLIHITESLLGELRKGGVVLEGAFYCLHAPSDRCPCRKPGVGLLKRAAEFLPIDFRRSFFIGDSPIDIQSGLRVGCATIYIGKDRDAPSTAKHRVGSIKGAVDWILATGV